MTNVPDNIREAWKELYILFDTNYGMDGSDKAWTKYWEQANKLIQKFGAEIPLLEMTVSIAKLIDTLHGNHSLEWKKDEPYPYPKGAGK